MLPRSFVGLFSEDRQTLCQTLMCDVVCSEDRFADGSTFVCLLVKRVNLDEEALEALEALEVE